MNLEKDSPFRGCGIELFSIFWFENEVRAHNPRLEMVMKEAQMLKWEDKRKSKELERAAREIEQKGERLGIRCGYSYSYSYEECMAFFAKIEHEREIIDVFKSLLVLVRKVEVSSENYVTIAGFVYIDHTPFFFSATTPAPVRASFFLITPQLTGVWAVIHRWAVDVIGKEVSAQEGAITPSLSFTDEIATLWICCHSSLPY